MADGGGVAVFFLDPPLIVLAYHVHRSGGRGDTDSAGLVDVLLQVGEEGLVDALDGRWMMRGKGHGQAYQYNSQQAENTESFTAHG